MQHSSDSDKPDNSSGEQLPLLTKPTEVDLSRRHFLAVVTSVLGGIGAFFAAIPFIASWRPSEKVIAQGAPVEVDISGLAPGDKMTVEWRGKPVWIIRRTPQMLDKLKGMVSQLRDPKSVTEQQPDYARNVHRSINPEFLVLIGICTHLGCSPTFRPAVGEVNEDWPGGFFCPCHGSGFDLSGRVFKGVPAPVNLEVPAHRFTSKGTLVIGEDEA